MNSDGTLNSTLALGEMFFNPNLVNTVTLPQILDGLIRTISK